jgi:hypothetical protein
VCDFGRVLPNFTIGGSALAIYYRCYHTQFLVSCSPADPQGIGGAFFVGCSVRASTDNLSAWALTAERKMDVSR